MSIALFRATLKSNWILLLVFIAITLGYLIMILSMFDPENLKAIESAIEMAPPGLAAAVGMDKIPVNVTDFAANYFYGFLVQLFLIVHMILLPLRLVVKHVDNGSMSYLLSTPNSRGRIAATQACYLVVSLAVLALAVTSIAIGFAQSVFPGELDIQAFISLNFTTYLLSLAMGSITFLFSCIWNETRYAAASSSAVLIMFFVLSLVGRYGHSEGFYGIAERFSIFQLLQARAIVEGEIDMVLNNGLLLLITAVGLIGGIWIFKKKDLPL